MGQCGYWVRLVSYIQSSYTTISCTGLCFSSFSLINASLNSSLTTYSTILPTKDAIYAIGLTSSLASYTLHVTSLNPSTGEVIADINLPSSIANGLNDWFVVASSSATTTTEEKESSHAPTLVWLEAGTIKQYVLTPPLPLPGKKTTTTLLKEKTKYREIRDVGVGKYGYFVGIKEGGMGVILNVVGEGDKERGRECWEFEGSVSIHVQLISPFLPVLFSFSSRASRGRTPFPLTPPLPRLRDCFFVLPSFHVTSPPAFHLPSLLRYADPCLNASID
jgi:hypothetical protein